MSTNGLNLRYSNQLLQDADGGREPLAGLAAQSHDLPGSPALQPRRISLEPSPNHVVAPAIPASSCPLLDLIGEN